MKRFLPFVARHRFIRKQFSSCIPKPSPRKKDFSPSRKKEVPSRSNATQAPSEDTDLIYGRRIVLTALENKRQLNRLWIVPQLRYDPRFHPLLLQAKASGTAIDEVDYKRLDRLTRGASHQGVAAQVAAYEYLSLDELTIGAKAASSEPILLAADGITDPHNLGGDRANGGSF